MFTTVKVKNGSVVSTSHILNTGYPNIEVYRYLKRKHLKKLFKKISIKRFNILKQKLILIL